MNREQKENCFDRVKPKNDYVNNLKAGKQHISTLVDTIMFLFQYHKSYIYGVFFVLRMKYSGRCHTEGHEENIVAVGAYYLHVDDELEGGALKFRPKDAPDMHVYEEIQTDFEVSLIGTGAAVVFSNSMPHCFRQIRNLTQDDGRRRTFLNFFIVDPDQPIHHPLNERILAPIDTVFEILH